jgi:hypothetical protein
MDKVTMRQRAKLPVRVVIGFGAALLLASPTVAVAAERSPIERPGQLTPNQLFGGRALTPAEALAACGPAAAVAFANATGRAVSLDKAVAVAREVGWSPSRGMSGPYGQMSLLQKLNIPATIEAGADPTRIKREVQAGRPVIIRTSGAGVPGHYFVAERMDPATGRYDFGQSALVLRASGGRRWFSLSEIGALGAGAPTHAIYLKSQPQVQAMAASAGPLTGIASAADSAVNGATRIVATGGTGANLRAAPGTTAKIVGALLDGARVTPTGATVTVAGRVWQRVTLASGAAAWMDGSLLRP